ncbi:M50 family metallopeptidase [Clostridium carnis]
MRRETKRYLAEIVLIILVCSYNQVFLLAFIWVILHELAHVVMALLFGCKFYNIEVHIFGMKAELLELDGLTDRKRILVYLSGAMFNIIMACIMFIIWKNTNSEIILTNMDLNIGLAIFNLLPAYPLDGARVLEIVLSKKILFKKAQKIISGISYFIAVIFFFISLGIFIFLHNVNISMILGGIIIIYITRVEQKTTMYITMRNIVKKRNKLIKNKYIENKSLSVYYKHCLVNVLGLVDRNKFNTFYILDDDMNLLYTMHEDELVEALKIYGNITLEEYMHERYGN